jgi:hypothetical protein
MRFVLIVSFVLSLSSRAFAEDKSESTAVMLSLGVTTGGVVSLIAGGPPLIGVGALYFGPSTGQWYAGELGGLGLGLRAAGAASMLYGLHLVLQSESDCEPELDGDCSAEATRANRVGATGAVLMWSGAGLWVGSTIYDVVLARRAASRWNERHRVTVAPLAANGATGLVVGARF